MVKIKFSWKWFTVLMVLFLSTAVKASMFDDIKISSFMQKKQHHEVIKLLQLKLDKKEKISSFQLYLLASAYSEIRDYRRMLSAVDQLEKQIQLGDDNYFGADLAPFPTILRAFVALEMGDYSGAIKEAEKARECLQQSRPGNNFDVLQQIEITKNLGIAYALTHQNAEADQCIAAAEKISVAGTINGPEKFIAIARIYMAKKQFDKALMAIRNPEAKVTGLVTAFYDQTFQDLPKYYILIKCLYETGKLQEATEGYDQLLKHPQIKQIGGLYWPILLDRARLARAAGQQALAEDLLMEAVDVIEKQRSSIATEAGRIGYVGDKQEVYQELISLLVDSDRAGEALEYVERAKSRALVDLLAAQRSIVSHVQDEAAIRATMEQLAAAEQALSIVGDPSVTADLNPTRGIVVTLKKQISRQAPEFACLVTVTRTPLKEIQERLAENETLLEYYSTNQNWFVFVLRHDGVMVRKLDAAGVDQDVMTLRKSLARPASDAYASRSQILYDKLITPVAGMIGTGILTIIPHGALHYVPFGVLSADGSYLIDRCSIRVLPSASVLKFLKQSKTPGNALILGNPDLGNPKYTLKFAQEEAVSVAKILPQATVCLGSKATATVVKSVGGGYDLIHCAAHGIFDADNPLHSALLLAPDNHSNGVLSAGDFYNLSLSADLVTLSACETALGRVSNGDDVMGFTRGLLYAGTGSIVSSLWQVDDQATRDLMIRFYTELSSVGKAEALRQAQLGVKKQYPHPFYWAGFVLTGNAR